MVDAPHPADTEKTEQPPQEPLEATETPLAYRAVRGGLWVMASAYWTAGFAFVCTLLLARLLAPEAFGMVSLASFFAQLLRLQPKLGLSCAYAQQNSIDGRKVGTYVGSDVAAAIGGLAIIAIAIPVLLAFGYDGLVIQVIVLLSFGALFESLALTGETLLDRELHFTQGSMVQSITFPLSYVPAIFMAINGFGVWSLVAQNLTYNFLWMLAIWLAARRKLPQLWQIRWSFDRLLAKNMLRFGVTVGMGALAGMLLTTLDNFLIGTFVGLAALGFYDRAYRTAQWPATLLLGLLNRIAFFTYANVQNDAVRLRKAAAMVLWLIAISALPLALVVFITAPDLLVVLYGERWLPSALLLRILVVYAVARPLWDNASALFIAIGKPRLSTSLIIAQVVILAVVGFPATLLWQAVGTCTAVALAFIVGLALAYRHLIREVTFSAVGMVAPALVISVVVVAAYVVLSATTGLASLPIVTRLLLKVSYVVMVFYGLTLAIQPRATINRLLYVWGLLRQKPQTLVFD